MRNEKGLGKKPIRLYINFVGDMPNEIITIKDYKKTLLFKGDFVDFLIWLVYNNDKGLLRSGERKKCNCCNDIEFKSDVDNQIHLKRLIKETDNIINRYSKMNNKLYIKYETLWRKKYETLWRKNYGD